MEEKPKNQDEMHISPAQVPVVVAPQDELLQSAEVTKAELGAFLAITGTILSVLPLPPVAIIGMALILWGTAVPFLWPESTGGNEVNTIWNSIVGRVGEMIDQRLTALAMSDARDAATKLVTQCKIVKRSLQDWIDSGKQTGAGTVRGLYIVLIYTYRAELIRDLARTEYRSALVSLFVNGAFNYITLLGELYVYADELQLGVANSYVQTGKEHVAREITEGIPQFIDIAIESYRLGLAKIISRSKDPNLSNKPTWLDYNEYRNVHTIAALDFLPLLSYADPANYHTTVSAKFLNRSLMTCVDTNSDYRLYTIEQIEHFDAEIFPRIPSMSLVKLEWKVTHESDMEPFDFDGLAAQSFEIKSNDGFARGGTSGWTVLMHANMHVATGYDISGLDCIYNVTGEYWNANKSAPGSMPRTITKFVFQVIDSYKNRGSMSYVLAKGSTPGFVKPFEAGILVKDQASGAMRPGMQLAGWHNSSDSDDRNLFFFRWKDISIGKDMLPLKAHQISTSNPIEQFHAIRAANSIYSQSLTIVPGPGFTGGDLVQLRAGTSLMFLLEKDPARWFAGMYKIRIWYVLPEQDVDTRFEISVVDGLSSHSDIAIQGRRGAVAPDLKRLKYDDLKMIESEFSILITENTRNFRMIFTNIRNFDDMDADLVIDRLELVFQVGASDPAVN